MTAADARQIMEDTRGAREAAEAERTEQALRLISAQVAEVAARGLETTWYMGNVTSAAASILESRGFNVGWGDYIVHPQLGLRVSW